MAASGPMTEAMAEPFPGTFLHPIKEETDSLCTWEDKTCSTCPATIPAGEMVWKRQCGDCFRDDRTKRMCVICCKPKIPITADPWRKYCTGCYADSPNAKQCESCKEYNIKACEWRKLCKQCFQDKKFTRTCETCHARPVDSKHPAYIKTCTRCYLEKKKQTHATCPTCLPPFDKMYRRRIGSPGCRECMMHQGLIKVN
jgi:hypothetical protein